LGQANVSGNHVTEPLLTENRSISFEVTPAVEQMELEISGGVSELNLRIAPPDCTVERADECGWVVPTENIEARWQQANVSAGVWNAQVNIQSLESTTQYEIVKRVRVPVAP